MANETETLDSPNEETGEVESESNDDATVLKEKNRQLFERAKKAEGELKEMKAKRPEAPKEPESQPKESSELDYGQKAFLKASGLSGADEIQLAKDFAKRTGEPLDMVVEDDIFKARLEKLRTTKANTEAAEIPTGRR